ncbi:uncharacterized protein BO97DRAFT_121170 [Aspergillus homomorphus CBS 101889]|uniref:Uncharacterized protein n=1 Tax=Aspergillus homomorphus (strain CBS 101889) TaxID=1450537 RepID=A0A395HRT6_ASPHC|nr:hypothetical protein BO97DRAFT_121170 [Aspergillus homomorphus CBS 101889]RAL10527.1 hypothetical protein BO97DRAFT_121170 [Aspergillus homomorphus CBS 101889]
MYPIVHLTSHPFLIGMRCYWQQATSDQPTRRTQLYARSRSSLLPIIYNEELFYLSFGYSEDFIQLFSFVLSITKIGSIGVCWLGGFLVYVSCFIFFLCRFSAIGSTSPQMLAGCSILGSRSRLCFRLYFPQRWQQKIAFTGAFWKGFFSLLAYQPMLFVVLHYPQYGSKFKVSL